MILIITSFRVIIRNNTNTFTIPNTSNTSSTTRFDIKLKL